VADAFSGVTNEQLLNMQVAMILACGRSKPVLARRRQQWFCFLNRVLQIEANNRGIASIAPPVHAGDLPPGPQAL
jgi:hypothetical protein